MTEAAKRPFFGDIDYLGAAVGKAKVVARPSRMSSQAHHMAWPELLRMVMVEALACR
jgi:hypothetical protein